MNQYIISLHKQKVYNTMDTKQNIFCIRFNDSLFLYLELKKQQKKIKFVAKIQKK